MRLEASDALLARLKTLLTPDENARADRYIFDAPRLAYVISRAALRILLARYTGINPQELRFRYGPKDKPSLDAPAPIQFNVSHSGGLALLAFTHICEIGVDVEQIRPIKDMLDIARRFFCAEEVADLLGLPPDRREHGFYLCWTRKEAYIKATGEGLSVRLDAFRVALRPGEPATFIHLDGDRRAAQQWSLHDLDAGPGYCGALAYYGARLPVDVKPTVDPTTLLA